MPTNPYRGRLKRPSHAKTCQLYIERMLLNVEHLKEEGLCDYHVQAQVPEAWDTLEQDIDVEEPKLKMTLLLDESVVKFYRAMGKGYQARINRILATFAQMRIAQVRRLDEMMEKEIERIAEMRQTRLGGEAAEG